MCIRARVFILPGRRALLHSHSNTPTPVTAGWGTRGAPPVTRSRVWKSQGFSKPLGPQTLMCSCGPGTDVLMGERVMSPWGNSDVPVG